MKKIVYFITEMSTKFLKGIYSYYTDSKGILKLLNSSWDLAKKDKFSLQIQSRECMRQNGLKRFSKATSK